MCPGWRQNPYDDVLKNLVQAMHDVDGSLTELSRDVRPFDSQELTPEEDEMLFHNPAQRYIGQNDPATGMPLTNAQAAQRLLAEIGPIEYVKYVEDVMRRADRRAKDASP